MAGRMIEVEGFKAFRGSMEIWIRFHMLIDGKPRIISGEWLYRPDTDCWYCNGVSYPARCCKVLEVE